MLAYGIGLGWLGCECQNYLLRQPAWAEVSGRGTLLRDRDWESPSCTHRLRSRTSSRLLSVGLWARQKSGSALNETTGAVLRVRCRSQAAPSCCSASRWRLQRSPLPAPGPLPSPQTERFHAKRLETAPVLNGRLSGRGARWCFEACPERGLPNNPKPAEPRMSPGLKNKDLL